MVNDDIIRQNLCLTLQKHGFEEQKEKMTKFWKITNEDYFRECEYIATKHVERPDSNRYNYQSLMQNNVNLCFNEN